VKVSYKSSGVNIPKAEDFVDKIKPLVKRTFNKSVLSGLGNFGAFFKPDLSKYKNPVFVSSVDGVGTKIKIAASLGIFDTVGEDLVNHCVNDIAVCGASPLFFLDYYSVGKLITANAVDIVKGLTRGCVANGCSLVGGETAEMPGLYQKDDFDLAGAIFGIVDKNNIVNYSRVKKGDIMIGIESSGLHTNGYSLVRKIFDNKAKLNKYYPDLNNKFGLELLKVHRSYFNLITILRSKFDVKSISHITGGGIEGNTKRVIPKDRKMKIDWTSWERPPIFSIIQKAGNVPESDMRRTFNLGIGMIFIVPESQADKVIGYLQKKKEKSSIIGSII
jgi:phosphoribosylformylglycinamidine cyclo-ligase